MAELETFSFFVETAPDPGAIGSNDYLALVQGGKTKRATVADFSFTVGLVSVTLITAASVYNATADDYFIGVNKAVSSTTTINLLSTGLIVGRRFEIADVAGNIGPTTPNVIKYLGTTLYTMNFASSLVTATWLGASWFFS